MTDIRDKLASLLRMKASESVLEQDRLQLHTEALSYYISGCGKGSSLYAKAGGTTVSLLSSVREKDLCLLLTKCFCRARLKTGSLKEVPQVLISKWN